jgi:hypothetical protein
MQRVIEKLQPVFMIIEDLCKLALLTQNFNFLKNGLYDLAQTFPDDSTILMNML